MNGCEATTGRTKKAEDWPIIHMVTRGITNKEIARRLQLTENQVKYRIYKVLRTRRQNGEAKTFEHINLYLDTKFVRELCDEAGREGVSLNRYILYVLRSRKK